MSNQAIEEYLSKRKYSFSLQHETGIITGYGRTEDLAKADAERQAELVKIDLPDSFNKRGSDELIENSESSKPRWYKSRAHEPVRWYKAIEMLVKETSLKELASRMGVSQSKITKWKRKLATPSAVDREKIIPVLCEILNRTQMGLCNIDIPEKESLRYQTK